MMEKVSGNAERKLNECGFVKSINDLYLVLLWKMRWWRKGMRWAVAIKRFATPSYLQQLQKLQHYIYLYSLTT